MGGGVAATDRSGRQAARLTGRSYHCYTRRGRWCSISLEEHGCLGECAAHWRFRPQYVRCRAAGERNARVLEVRFESVAPEVYAQIQMFR